MNEMPYLRLFKGLCPVGLLMLLFPLVMVWGQPSSIDSIQPYFDRIDALIAEKEKYPEQFLDIDYLLAARDRSMGERKVEVLLRLHDAHVFHSLAKAKEYNDEALGLARELDYDRGRYHALYNQAYLHFVQGDFQKAMLAVTEIAEKIDSESFPEVYADIVTLKCDIHTERGHYDRAMELGLQLLDKAEKGGHPYIFMRAYAALSHSYLRLGKNGKAREYCLKNLAYIIDLKRTEYFYPKTNEIARMTAKLEGPEAALQIFDFFHSLEQRMNPPGGYVRSITYMILSDIYASLGAFDQAQFYLTKGLQLNYQNNYRFRIPRALVQQAELNLQKGDTGSAIRSYEKSLQYAEAMNAFDLVKSNSLMLSRLYEDTRQFGKAYEYTTLHNAIIDSFFTSEHEQKISILEARRTIKEVTQQKKILELKNEAQQGRYNSVAIALICLVLFSGLATYGYIQVRRKNHLLYQRTMELTKVQMRMKEQSNLLDPGSGNIQKTGTPKHAKSKTPLDEEVRDIIMERLLRLENDRFFLHPNCNLHQVAELLKTNTKYLSQVINQEKNSNFNNYINGLRIDHLLERLIQEEEFRNGKLSYIAASVGYNNLNTFNNAFKKRLGILPSFFIDRLNKGPKRRFLEDLPLFIREIQLEAR